MNWVVTYRHWAGFKNCTHVFTLAVSYVCIKQLSPPSHCNLRPPPFEDGHRHRFSRSYPANLPISLNCIAPDTLEASHLGAPVLVLGTSTRTPWFVSFHWHLEPAMPPTVGRSFMLSPGSRDNHTPRAYTFGQGDNPASLIHLRQDKAVVLPRIVFAWLRNINRIPFPPLAITLGVRTD